MVGGRFTERARIIINYASEEAIKLNHDQIDTEHLLLGLVHEGQGIAARAIQELGVSLEKLEMEVKKMVKKPSMLSDSRRSVDFSPSAKQVLQYAMEEAHRLEFDHVGTEHILLGLIREKNGVAGVALGKFGITLEKVRRVLKYQPTSTNPSPRRVPRSIDQYSRDLTQLAKDDMLDPIIGRDNEMERIMQILIRRKKNNPVLIGEPGVGKTAIVEGLAQKIICREVPDSLLDKRLVTLDLAGLVAGTKYRGQFEERLKNIMNEIRQSQDIILFIDEIHTIVGTGAAEGAIDAANMLKPALSRGEIQCIGATTLDEYRKYIEKDGALERRFQIVNVPQPTVEDTIEILKGLKDKYEDHHNVNYSSESLSAAAKLSAQYVSDRFLPDKAIDLIDEAGSYVRMAKINASTKSKNLNESKISIGNEQPQRANDSRGYLLNEDDDYNIRFDPQNIGNLSLYGHQTKRILDRDERLDVSEEDIAAVISKWTGIPISKLEETESEKLMRMEDVLRDHVIGQDLAIHALTRAVRRSRAGLKDLNRPIGSFIFIGPTGVGKSYLAAMLAEFLFGSQDAIIRLDMSEFMEKFSVSRLVGAPPGYVGYQEGGELTEKVRRHPYSVILLDEIEKAHPDVFNLLLQVLDNGRLSDNLGHTVDFRNTILIMTSNAGSRDIAKGASVGFQNAESSKSYETMRSHIMSELKRVFNPEFLNRIDDVITFNLLDRDHIAKIAEIMLNDIKKRLKENNIEIVFLSNTIEFIIEKGYDPHFGARHLRRELQRYIEDPIAEKMLDGSAYGCPIYVSLDGDKLCFDTAQPVTVDV
ncbi:MAG: ATP-dependent Clp protease ATP-binding subunit ClpC [Candidatus Poribacteria bacterium]|nr:ATP-dependent Clp protease ATP-binding subunit ClpC [Candidatus Poribacteria bacterium]